MKLWFKITAVVAVLLLIPLQYLMLRNVYDSLSENIESKVNACFKRSVYDEILLRATEYKETAELLINIDHVTRQIPRAVILGLNDKMYASGIAMNWDTLRVIFNDALLSEGLQNIEYKIIMTVNDLSSDEVIPITSDLSQGLRVIVINPYKVVISKMLWLLICSAVITLFILFCLISFARTLLRLTRLSKMRQDHTYAMVHDMRTPLSTISLIADDLRGAEGVDKEEIEILGNESAHLNKMCDRVIAVAKLEQQKLRLNYEEIDIAEFYNYQISKCLSLKKAKFIVADILYESVYADRLYLTEIFNNLIDNSLKYSGESVTITLSAMLKAKSPHKGKYVELHITDNGIGFSDDMRRKLFKKFSRGENTVGMGGHGMGLHYVYQLMKAFKGYISVESRQGLFTKVVLGFPIPIED